jgi:hypothetical protein
MGAMKSIKVEGKIVKIMPAIEAGFVQIGVEGKFDRITAAPKPGVSPYMQIVIAERDAEALCFGAPCRITLELL